MNNSSENANETARPDDRIDNKGFFANQVEKLKQKDFTCPLCRDVVKGISAFGRHLKEHCT